MLVLHRAFSNVVSGYPRIVWVLESAPGKIARWMVTFLLIVLSWSLFQPDLGRSVTLLQRLFCWAPGEALPMTRFYLWVTVGLVMLGHLCASRGWLTRIWKRTPASLGGLAFALLLICALVLAPARNRVFIYFQF